MLRMAFLPNVQALIQPLLCHTVCCWCVRPCAAGQLAFDAALPAVRVAVLEGLQLLVDNQHAQPVLKV